MSAQAADWGAIFKRFHTWTLMGGIDITMRYRRSLLGPFWISFAMAAMVLVIGSLYSQVMAQPREEFLPYLACGMLAWTYLSTMINEGCLVVVEAQTHLRSANIPIPVLAARMVYRNTLIFAHNAIVIIAMLLVLGHNFSANVLFALPGLAAYVVLGLLVGVAIGPICARFRDLSSLTTNVVQIMFFLTPIFWVPGAASARPVVVDINPFYHLVEVLRQPLLGHPPMLINWIYVGVALAGTALCAITSLALCRRKVFLWL